MSRDVVFVRQIAHPGARRPAAVVAFVDERQVVLIPGVDLVADGVELPGVRLVLPVVGLTASPFETSVPSYGRICPPFRWSG